MNAVEEIAKLSLWFSLGTEKTTCHSQQLRGRSTQNMTVMVRKRRGLTCLV